MFIIKEAIYGNMATVFHRTSVSDLVNKIFDSGFKPGDGAMYGKGFYSTYELESQFGSNMEKIYGPIIVKFACPIQTFFIFDYEEFKKSPNFNKLKKPSSDEFLKSQFKFFKMDYSDFSFEKAHSSKFTSDTALWCTKNIPNFQRLCEGVIFTGSRDGKVLVSYNTKLIFPLSYTSNDGETWEKVEKNLDYLKKVAKVKNRFVVDLSSKPEEFGIKNYEFDSNGFLNVKDDVDLSDKNLARLPFKFGKVVGNFKCSFNKLTSLNGAPKEVVGIFDCAFCNLTSLNGAPKKVKENFDCHCNDLTSLEGAPEKVGRSFYCNGNKLTSLKGAPKEVGRDFKCADNNLTSLEGAPKEVVGNFNCKNNKTKFTKEDVEKVCNVKGEIIV